MIIKFAEYLYISFRYNDKLMRFLHIFYWIVIYFQ